MRRTSATLFLVLGLSVCPADAWATEPDAKAPMQREFASPTVLDLGGGVAMTFVPLPPGEFFMGTAAADPNHAKWEEPPHWVWITWPFRMGATEVTQAQYERVMHNNPSRLRGPTLPVENVSWRDAMAFCDALTRREREAGRLNAGEAYRLPTEAEWEYACRSGTTSSYSFGDDPARLTDCAWFDRNAAKTTHPAGTKRPNPWGLYDMHGNVWEMCLDGYRQYAPRRAMDPVEPAGDFCVVRGGSFAHSAVDVRSASRTQHGIKVRHWSVGFRCVRAAAVVAGPPEKYPANLAPVDVENDFAKANPEYKWRAGASYEKDCLDRAVVNLAKEADLDEKQAVAARAILRAFIYDWLDSYIRGNGSVGEEALKRHIALINERFLGELSPDQYAKYVAWRTDRTGARNPLAFLMPPPPALKTVEGGPPEARSAAERLVAGLADGRMPWERWVKYAEDQTVGVRRQAVNVLAGLKEHARFRQRALLHFLKHDSVPNVRAAAASALTIANPQATAALITASADETAEVRLFACQSLGFEKPGPEVGLPAVHRALLARISDNGPGVALAAIRSLGRLRHRPAVDRIIARYRRHPNDVQTAWTCAEALARLGETEVFFDAARVAFKSDNWNIRTFVVQAMPEVDSPRLAPFIIEHLTGEMELAVANHKAHRIEPRTFRLMIDLLEKRTGQSFGTNVARWAAWQDAQTPPCLPAHPPIRRPTPALQEAFDAIWQKAYTPRRNNAGSSSSGAISPVLEPTRKDPAAHTPAVENQDALPIRVVPNRAWRPIHHGDAVRGVRGPKGRFAACVERVSRNVYVLDLTDTRPAWIIPAPKDLEPIAGLAFSRDGRTLAMSGPNGGLLLDLKSDRLTRAPWLAGGPVAFSPDDEVIWIAGRAGRPPDTTPSGRGEPALRCFTREGKQAKSLALATNLPGRITFAKDGRTLIVEGVMGYALGARHGGQMETVTQTIDLRTDKSTAVVGKREHGGGAHRSVEHLLFPDVLPKADGRRTHGQDFLHAYWNEAMHRLIVHASGMPEGGALKAWASLERAAFAATLGTSNNVQPIGQAPDGRLIVRAWYRVRDLPENIRKHGMNEKPDEHVQLVAECDPATGRTTPRLIPGGRKAFLLSPDGRHLAAVLERDGLTLEIWRLADAKRLAAISADDVDLNRLQWTRSGSHLAARVSAKDAHWLDVWTPDGQRTTRVPAPSHDFALSPDGRLVAFGGSAGGERSGYVSVVDTETGKERRRYTDLDVWWGTACFIDAERLLVGDHTGASSWLALHWLSTDRPIWRVKAQGQVQAIRLSAGGKVAVFDHQTYGAGADIRRMADGSRLPEGATAPAWYRPTPIADGRLVLDPVLRSNIIRLAETATGKTIATFAPFADPEWMVWTPDGLWSGSENALDWVSFYRGSTPLSRDAVLSLRKPSVVQERIRAAVKRVGPVGKGSTQ